MTPERWKEVEDAYEAVMARPAGARAQAMDEICEGDEDLRREVESLVALASRAEGFLEAPALAVAEVVDRRSLIGRRVGPYLFLSLLGQGGMGEVYRAHDESLGRDVAIKLLPRLRSGDPQLVARFEGEARILAALNHPHIGAIYGLERVDGSPALVLELVDGETLADRIARAGVVPSAQPLAPAGLPTGIPLREALVLARQIAMALEAAHERSIVHRDLKPANIKIAPDGVVKVLDFGLAKLMSHEVAAAAPRQEDLVRPVGHTRDGVVLGTIGYMSPEQAACQAADTRADVWALAVVIFEMLTGRPAFAAETVEDVRTATLTAEPDWSCLPAETPAAVRTLLQRGLEKDRSRRFESAMAVRLVIEEALAALDGAVTSPQRSAAGRRGRLARASAVIAVITMVSTAAALWRLWQQDYFWRNPLSGATVERLTDFEGDEFDAAISPDGRVTAFLSDRDGVLDAWVNQAGSGDFVNLTQGRFQLTANRITRQVGFAADPTKVWFLQQVGERPVRWTSWLAPVSGDPPEQFVDGGLNPVWSPDGRHVAYHSADPGDPIFVADRDGGNPRRVHQALPGVHNHHPMWSLDGRDIFFVSGTPQTEEMDIWRIRVNASDGAAMPERITSHHALVGYPAWLDARTLIYTATADDGSGQWLYAIDVERRIPHRVSSGVAEEYLSVAISSARAKRLVAAMATPIATLWTIPLADDLQTEQAASRVRAPNSRASGPRFAPGYMAFLSSKGGGNGLWKRENGVDQELWRGDGGGIVTPPAISPDGRLICFAVRRHGKTRLHVMNADGTNPRVLLESLDVRGSAWSPDGKSIVVAANLGAGTRLFKIPTDGGRPLLLLDALADRPEWSPDGRFILYSALIAAGGDEIRAITPDGVPISIPRIRIGTGIRTSYRFMPDGKSLIVLEGPARNAQNFFRVDLQSGAQRQLTDLAGGAAIQHFDVSPDGRQITFDRVRLNADIVVMNLAAR